jgi:hypothetical protein
MDGVGIRSQLEKSACAFDYESMDGPRFWESTLGLSHVPRALLERIVAWVGGTTSTGSVARHAGWVPR